MGEDPQNARAVVAVVDDDEAARVSIEQMLSLRGLDVQTFSSAEAALAWPGLPDADCVVTDIKMPGLDGEQLLAEMLRRSWLAPVVMITGHGDISMAVRCLKGGAYDFVEKPFDEEVLLAGISRAVERTRLRREAEALRRRVEALSPEEGGRFHMVGVSRVMRDLYQEIETMAASDAPVVISGETGAGKELVARAIHGQSGRADGPFVPVNAGALPETMIESELFGHVKGAFTGADRDRDGKLVTASGGTLLLDEVEALSERAQVQLLRVLEDGLVTAVGRDEPRRVDVRLLVTTKQDLKEAVARGAMREDFYHRIAVLWVCVPSLRERVADIPLLISHFARRASERSAVPVPEIPEPTLAGMMRYLWPGNVRELEHAVERMVITSHNGVAGPVEFADVPGGERLMTLPATSGRLSVELERTEQTVIEQALREQGGEVTAAAASLGISRRALYERMKKYGLRKEDYRCET